MKFIWGIIFAWLPSSIAAANCTEPDIWPKVTAWLCSMERAMDETDQGLGYQRTIRLVTDRDDLKQMRLLMNKNDSQVCRRFKGEHFEAALSRINSQQGFDAGFDLDIRLDASKELRRLSPYNSLTMCEGDDLIEGGSDRPHEYHRYHYLKLGPERAFKNIMIHTVSRWPAS